jgi:hypothetical protein
MLSIIWNSATAYKRWNAIAHFNTQRSSMTQLPSNFFTQCAQCSSQMFLMTLDTAFQSVKSITINECIQRIIQAWVQIATYQHKEWTFSPPNCSNHYSMTRHSIFPHSTFPSLLLKVLLKQYQTVHQGRDSSEPIHKSAGT